MVFDGLEHLGRKFVFVFSLIDVRLLGDVEHRWTSKLPGAGACACSCAMPAVNTAPIATPAKSDTLFMTVSSSVLRAFAESARPELFASAAKRVGPCPAGAMVGMANYEECIGAKKHLVLGLPLHNG
jgi:hypothetical protein